MSAERVTVTLALSELLPVTGSVGLWPLRLAVLPIEVAVEEGLIWARILTVVEPLAARGSTARLPVQALLVARVASQLAPVQYLAFWSSPESVSLRVTALLSEGPLLVTSSV